MFPVKTYIIHSSIFKRIITSITLLFFGHSLVCQNQKKADSLEILYTQGDYKEEYKLTLLKDLAKNHHNIYKKLYYSNELLAMAKVMDSSQYFYSAYLEKGNALADKGDLTMAIENYLKASNTAIEERELAMIYGSIAGVYIYLGNIKTAFLYYRKGIKILNKPKLLQERKDSVTLAYSFENLGYTYIVFNKPDSALIYLNESGVLFEKMNHEIGLAYNMGNKGLAYGQLKDYTKAENNINIAIKTLEKLGHYGAICELIIEISDFYLIRNDYKRASEFALRGLKMAKEHNLKSGISNANLQLSKIHEQTGNDKQSLAYYKNHIAFRDSVTNLPSIQEIADMRTEFEVDLKQAEVNLLNEQKTNQRVLIFSMIAILGMTGLYFRNINKEKRRSDELLLNILPSKTAEELKEHGKVKAKKFDSVSVMFTDFQAFTQHSQKLSPEELVKSVDYFFSKFDQIIDSYELEKIKTIGDAYMCAGGLTIDSPDQVIKVIHAAFEIKAFIEETSQQTNNDIAHFNIRIGINTGQVVAGVVGKTKFAYDIWGDTVNVASRMESNSDAGKINVSENTYQLIKDHFDCEYRGEIDVKNKGMMKMYFVNQPKNKDQKPVNDESLKVLC